jgi:hypothetical protein
MINYKSSLSSEFEPEMSSPASRVAAREGDLGACELTNICLDRTTWVPFPRAALPRSPGMTSSECFNEIEIRHGGSRP